MTENYQKMIKYVWDMQAKGAFTEDIEAHYRTAIYDLDIVTYDECIVDIDRLSFRKSMGTMAMTFPSLAMIDKHRTLEACYNIHLTARDIDHHNLNQRTQAFDSENLRTTHLTIACGFHHLMTGRNMFDDKLRCAAERMIRRCEQNVSSRQRLYALDTISGRYDMYTNLLMLLGFRLSDRILGTDYTKCEDTLIETLESKLLDREAGLFYEYYQTGAFGFAMEELSESAFWTVKNLKIGTNALAISLYHLFRPEQAQKMWLCFKERFADSLLKMTIDHDRIQSNFSYLTELGFNTEDLFAALLCAKEMNDREFFEKLLAHIYTLVKPKHIETKVIYEGFTGGLSDKLSSGAGPACTYFSLFAQVHAGWKNILEYDWESQYGMDYNIVR